LIDLDDPSPTEAQVSHSVPFGTRYMGEVDDVVIKNLDKSIDEAALRRLFERFGRILHATVTVDERGISRGNGCVSFAHHADALLAVRMMNNELVGSQRITAWVPESAFGA